MLISHSHSFIFIHVAKVAGSSVRYALDPYIEEPLYFKIKRPKKEIKGKVNPLYIMWDAMVAHATAEQTQQQFPDEFKTFYKFAFVRNPWDWQVSMYHFILKEKLHIHHKMVTELGNFKRYLEWVVEENKPYPKGATKLQKTMLVDKKGQIMVNRIGRFETLNEDFNKITTQLGLRASLPKINNSFHQNYQDYYTDYTKCLVAKYFLEDIDLFKYTFKGTKF